MKNLIGTIRLGKDLRFYELTRKGWKISSKEFPSAINAVKLFKAHNLINSLTDSKDSKFLKGQIYKSNIQGSRINILPNGKKLDKAFSLFADNLTFHDETSHAHWDVIYRNPNGKYAYLYTLNKRNKSVSEKYKKVYNFDRVHELLGKKVLKALEDRNDNYALPMYTLLKTYMRVGNETYYKAHGHKGLTTLTKGDIKIKGDEVEFNYLAKSGVPMDITERFPSSYISRLKSKISGLKNNDFVFTLNNNPMKDTDFMKAFEKYCGERFYPHIVRSHYATMQAKRFLNTHKKATKSEVQDLFNSIAEKLGHKKFSKKDNEWKSSSNVTIHYYLEPSILEKINNLVK